MAIRQRSTFVSSGGGFHYLEVIKGKASPGDKLPLIIGFHYSSSTPLEASKDYGSIKIPVRIILPKGNYRKRDGFTYFPISLNFSREEVAELKRHFSITLTTYPGLGHDYSPEMKAITLH